MCSRQPCGFSSEVEDGRTAGPYCWFTGSSSASQQKNSAAEESKIHARTRHPLHDTAAPLLAANFKFLTNSQCFPSIPRVAMTPDAPQPGRGSSEEGRVSFVARGALSLPAGDDPRVRRCRSGDMCLVHNLWVYVIRLCGATPWGKIICRQLEICISRCAISPLSAPKSTRSSLLVRGTNEYM